MTILIAPNAFKGCLAACAAAEAMAAGARAAAPGARLDLMPVSDGGDGLMEVLLRRFGGARIRKLVAGPLGERRSACYALLEDGRTAVVEMARASGIAGLETLDPLRASSRGTGQLIADALRRGRRRIVVGLGGSASSDGGAGMAAALGARFYDARGRELPPGAAPLARLARIDVRGLEPRLKEAEVLGVSDVSNPLLGPLGSARVYGPQKGATPAMVRVLEDALARYALVLRRDLGSDVSRLPGGGAAGGLGAGLAALCGARLARGAQWMLDLLDADRRLRRAALVLTGEGRLDRQSFFGKAPVALARRARRFGAPVRFLCGQVEPEAAAKLRGLGRAYPLLGPGESPARAMAAARPRLRRAAFEAVREALAAGLAAALLVLCSWSPVSALDLAEADRRNYSAPPTENSSPRRGDEFPTPSPGGMASVPSEGDLSSHDRLYFHRHQGGSLELSIAGLEAGLREAPEDPRLQWRLGRSLARYGERRKTKAEKLRSFERARDLLERSVKADPSEPEAHFWLGIAMGRIGQTRGVLRSLFLVGPIRREMKKVLELNPRHGGAHHVLGEMLRQIPAFAGGSKKKAVSELEKAVELDANYTANYPALAEACAQAGEPEKAKAALEKLFEIKEPTDPGGYDEDLADGREMLELLKRYSSLRSRPAPSP